MRSVRLQLSRTRENSTKAKSVPGRWDDGEPPEPPLQMSIALRGLMAEAEALTDQVDFADFVELAEIKQLSSVRGSHQRWKRVEHSATFSLLKCDDEVLALARLDATVEEVAKIFGATTDQTHDATMSGLYRDSFISGSVAYVQRTQDEMNNGVFHQLAVKTANFVRPDLMSKNEQWCYAELLRRKSEGGGFTLFQSSLSPSESQSLPARLALKSDTKRVAQLRDVTTAYSVERMPGRQSLRIVFHAVYNPRNSNPEDENTFPVVLQKAVRARLLRLARGIPRLSQLVRHRRFGTQIVADQSAFQSNNVRCTCCTRRLTVLMNILPRVRCYLCGYQVCVVCATSEKMETSTGHLASIMVCTRCCKTVSACNYEKMLSVSSGPARILPDSMVRSNSSSSVRTTSTRSSMSSSSSSSSLMLAELIGDIVDDEEEVSSGRRQAALVVLEQLLSADQTNNQAQADINAGLLKSAATTSHSLRAAEQALNVDSYPEDPALCVVASSAGRPYATPPALIQESEPDKPIEYPLPENEGDRLAAIEHFKLHDMANVPELNVICALAAAEMNCPHSCVTLVEQNQVTLLATNAPETWQVGSGIPRARTFCQHCIMDDEPLMVQHAEADMRFYLTAPVLMAGLRFYAGFPISVRNVRKTGPNDPDSVVVGVLCCLDARPHPVTRSQYWRLVKLSEATSAILERRADECLLDPELYPQLPTSK